MWVLRNVHNNEEQCFKMVQQGAVKVGRKDSDLCLGGNDHSISRHHAELSLVTQNGEEFLQVEDMGSRYGTYINNNIQPINCPKAATDNKMEPHTKVLLKSGDKVRFGLQWHIWFVYKYSYIVSSSKLDSTLSTSLQTTLRDLNIPFQTDWDASCTHLTMSGIVVTPKVACALASTKHIVTLGFWMEVARVLSLGSGFYPKEEDFLPPVLEKAAKCEAVSFLPNPTRTSLFEGLRFVALSQQQMRYFEQCITLAGGTIVNIHREKFTKKELLDAKTIVLTKTALHVESQPTQLNGVVDRLRDLFAKSQKRLVDESEIGFAIIFVSRESACNPYVPFALSQLSQELSQQTPSAQDSERVFSLSMIKTPRSARKRDRTPSPPTERKQSKRLASTGRTLTPSLPASSDQSVDMMTFRDSEKVVESGTSDSVMEIESATPRVVESTISTGPVQSEVFEIEDDDQNSGVDEVDRATSNRARSRRLRDQNTRNKETTDLDTEENNSHIGKNDRGSKRTVGSRSSRKMTSSLNSTENFKTKAGNFEQDNDSSEDELENLFSKCQRLSKNKAETAQSKEVNVLSESTGNNSRTRSKEANVLSEATEDNSCRTRGSKESNREEEMCGTESTNLERGSSSTNTSEDTRHSVFQVPTQRVSSQGKTRNARISSGESLDGWLSKTPSEARSNYRTNSSNKETDSRESKKTGSRQSTEETNTQLSRGSTSISRLNASRRVSSDEEEDIFEQSTLSRRHGNATMNHPLAGTSSIRPDNILANASVAQRFTSRANSFFNRNQEDEDEDNVFGAPACKPLSEIARLGRRNTVNLTENMTDSDGTSLGSNRPSQSRNQLPTLSKKRGIEGESYEMVRTAEVESLQDRGLLRDETDCVSIDTNCCVINVRFQLKKYSISPFLENKKIFKKQSLPGRTNKPSRPPLTFHPVYATVLDDPVKSEPLTAE